MCLVTLHHADPIRQNTGPRFPDLYRLVLFDPDFAETLKTYGCNLHLVLSREPVWIASSKQTLGFSTLLQLYTHSQKS